MHALFLQSLGGRGSLGVACCFFDFTGDEVAPALTALPFFFEGPGSVPLLLRFFPAEELGAAGEADIPRSEVWHSSLTTVLWSFLLRTLFLAAPLQLLVQHCHSLLTRQNGCEVSVMLGEVCGNRVLRTHHHFADS